MRWMLLIAAMFVSSMAVSHHCGAIPGASLCSMTACFAGARNNGEVIVTFANTDTRYPQAEQPVASGNEQTLTGWKGEKLSAQLLIWSSASVKKASIKTTGPFTVKTGFVRYVWSNGLNKEGHGCGIPPAHETDSVLVADGIDYLPNKSITANTTQPVWVSISIPRHAPGGIYKHEINIVIDGKTYPFILRVRVKDHVLPKPADWSFHLDLWQNPFSIARVHHLKPWSAAHFAVMKPYMKMLAEAGQKTITVSMIHDPWRGQTYDIYQSMVRWVKKKDGSWAYDYTVFDKWVAFMMQLGVDKLINCYTMVPWNNKFYYFDEATGKDTLLIAQTGTPEFEAHWKPMLTDFVKHLQQKNWYHKTAIAMDERPLADMQKVIALVRSVDKNFKLSLAGSYHRELTSDIYDYCIASAETFEADVLQQRVTAGLPTTYYTYCYEGHPNTFTFSPPAESTWLGWYAANKGFNGYLRWAFNCWPEKPLEDSRFSTWSAGDTYFVYPGAGSSIRFERLIEGIQDYEKIKVLRASRPAALEAVLSTFEIAQLEKEPAAEMLRKAKRVLEAL